MSWTKADDKTLIHLSKQNKYFNVEIASKMGFRPATVSHHARRLGLPSTQKTLRGRFGKWNAKHAHIREPVMRYFLNHTWEETREKFKLTQSELKSLFTVGYRLPEFRHLRKETRNHAPWSTREYRTLLTHAGLVPRIEIGEKLGRGKNIVIKERLQRLGLCSRTLQGITLSQFRQAFGRDPDFFIQTRAGPSRESVEAPTLWKIVPWVCLDAELKAGRLRAPKVFRQLASTMALFQNWIFKGNVVTKMKRIVRSV